jgi:hypothetical protein
MSDIKAKAAGGKSIYRSTRGKEVGVRVAFAVYESRIPPHPDPLPPVGGEGEARMTTLKIMQVKGFSCKFPVTNLSGAP